MIFTACVGKKEDDTKPEPLYPHPKTVKLNVHGGYKLNILTGDSINPILTKKGDTLTTGVPIPIHGKIIDPESVAKPTVVPLTTPKNIINAHKNLHKIPDDLIIVPLNKNLLPEIFISDIPQKDSSHYIVNELGDTIKTGIPLPIIGKVVQCTLPGPIESLPPGSKDAANSHLQFLDVDQGMASSYVPSMFEDTQGNLWFGTKAGACWYDGTYFRYFTENEGLSDNSVKSILEDKSSNLWFGTEGGGINLYNGKFFTHYTMKEGLSNNNITTIKEDKNGNIWFGTYGGGVVRFDGEFITNFTKNEGLLNNNVLSIIEDKTGKLWFGTEGGVSCYDGRSFTNYTQQAGLSNNSVISMLEDKAGNIWFGTTGGGVNRFDGKSFTQFTKRDGLSNNLIISIAEDNYGNMWFGTFNGGVNRFDGKYFEHFTQNEGLSNDYVFSIIEDNAGNLWFGTFGGGVNRYDGNSFTHFTRKEGLSNTFVLSILEDRSGKLWFGTEGGGVNIYDGSTFTYLSREEGLSSDHIYSIHESKDGTFWFGTYNAGVNRFDGKTFTHFTQNQGLTNNIVSSIAEDKSGNLWLATAGGLCKFNGEYFTHFTEDEGFPDNNVYSILVDKNDILYVGTGKGLTRFDGNTITNYSEKEGLPGNEVFSILEDGSGNLWIGTSAGLVRYNGESFTYFTKKEGLTGNEIRSIDQDLNGNLWLGTESGISEFKPSESNETSTSNSQHIYRFGKSDGIKNIDILNNSVCLDSRNQMWWGAGENVTMLNMDNFSVSGKPPTVSLRQLEINEKYINYRNLSDSLSQEIKFDSVQRFENYPLHLKLPYNKNHLTFKFSAIDWNAPHKIQYSYIMEGLNLNWSHATSEGKAEYRNLPYGEYKFKVCAIGESGIWSKAFEYNFTINPPWWHTWWARIIYILSSVVAIYQIFRWRLSNLKKRQKELEHEVEIATIEIRKQKNEIEKEKEEVEIQRNKSDELLLNILPAEIAEELKENGKTDARTFDLASILFTDFVSFTQTSEKLSATDLVDEINTCFESFDRIVDKYKIEKIKTIGDAYMAAGGLPVPDEQAVKNIILAALDMQDYMKKRKTERTKDNAPAFDMRAGIHTGPVVAGVVGVKKFQYDIWGDTVNTASRMESESEAGKVNISRSTYDLIKDDDQFKFVARGNIQAKGKGEIEMFFVEKR